MTALDADLLQEIAIQIRLDNPAPNDSMGYADHQAAVAISAFASAIEKIAERKHAEEIEPKVDLTFRVGAYGTLRCPLCEEVLVPFTEETDHNKFASIWKSHVYDAHPRRYAELVSEQRN